MSIPFPTEPEASPRPRQPRAPRSRLSPGLIGGIGAVAALIVVGVAPKLAQHQKLATEAHEAVSAEPLVNVVSPLNAQDQAETLLPGNIQAMDETTINARATGYVARYFVDIGSRVRAGQVLAEIESPDVDQQVLAAQADVQKAQAGVGQSRAEAARMVAGIAQASATQAAAKAALDLAKSDVTRAQAKALQAQASVSTAKANLARTTEALSGRKADLTRAQVAAGIAGKTLARWKQLGAVNAVSGEEVDEKQAASDTATANIEAAKAAVQGANADVDAARNVIAASQQDAAAAASDVEAARQKVAAAQATLESGRAGVVAARETASAGRENVAAAQAATASSLANVRRYAAMQGFQRVTAPFDGVITARNIDTGSLVGAGSGSGSGDANPQRTVTRSGLFGIARTDALRIQVNVPEEMVAGLKVGQSAKVTLASFPGKSFDGTVMNKSGALDSASRTMLVEVRLPNPSGALVPGMAAQVAFAGLHGAQGVTIPANTLIIDASGTRVAEVASDGKVHFQPVQIGRDLGNAVEVASGLSGNERLIADPSDDLSEGEAVTVTPESSTKNSASNTAKGGSDK